MYCQSPFTSHHNTARVLLLGLDLLVLENSDEGNVQFAYLGIEHLALG